MSTAPCAVKMGIEAVGAPIRGRQAGSRVSRRLAATAMAVGTQHPCQQHPAVQPEVAGITRNRQAGRQHQQELVATANGSRRTAASAALCIAGRWEREHRLVHALSREVPPASAATCSTSTSGQRVRPREHELRLAA
jgi:hypothetical protein